MSRATRKAPVYEVRCPTCAVTFPVGTRRCIHCGGPTTTPGAAGRLQALRELPFEFEPADEPPVEAEKPEEAPRRRGGRGMALLWLFLALAASLYRACTEAGPG